MPASAETALKGMLADGVDASQVLEKLKTAGYEVEPPDGDDSYAPPPKGAKRTQEMAGIEAEEEGPTLPGASREDRYKSAAMKAMKKHGYGSEE